MNSFEDIGKVTLAVLAMCWLGYLAVADSRLMGRSGNPRGVDVLAGINGNSEKSALFALPFMVCGFRLIKGDDTCID